MIKVIKHRLKPVFFFIKTVEFENLPFRLFLTYLHHSKAGLDQTQNSIKAANKFELKKTSNLGSISSTFYSQLLHI